MGTNSDIEQGARDAQSAASAPSTLRVALGAPRKVLFLRDFCTRPQGSSCMKCIEACPKEAIAIANASAAVDSHACTKCGICVGVCDGFAIPGASIEAVFSQMRKIALTGEKVVLTCSYLLPSSFTPADNVIVLPCLAMLPPELWTCALALGIDLAVAVIFEECEACKRTNSQGLERFSCAIEQAEDVTECTVAITDDVPEAQVAPTLMQTLGDASGKDRREALLNLKDQAEDIASGAYRMKRNESLRAFHEQRDHMLADERIGGAVGTPEQNAYAEGGMTRCTLSPRQRMLLEAADVSDAVAVRKRVMLSATDISLCDNSLACAKSCPTGARRPSPKDGQLVFEARLCIGCGLCTNACPQGAASLREAYAGELLPQPDDE